MLPRLVYLPRLFRFAFDFDLSVSHHVGAIADRQSDLHVLFREQGRVILFLEPANNSHQI